jgi:major vault protein
MGHKVLKIGEDSFFLRPRETLDGGIKNKFILSEDAALLLKAKETFKDNEGIERKPGDKWMVHGPRDYIPSTQVEVLDVR